MLIEGVGTCSGDGEGGGIPDETVTEGVDTRSGTREGAEISVGVTDDSVGLEIEIEVAEGSDGAEIWIDEVDSDITGEIEVDSTEVGGEIRCPNPPLKEESVETGLLELGSGTSSGLTSSEIVGISDGGDMTLPTSTGSGSSSITTDSDSSASLGGSIDLSTSISSDFSSRITSDSSSVISSGSLSTISSGSSSIITSDSSSSVPSDSSSTIVLSLSPQRHSAVPKSVEVSLRQTSQVSKSVLVSVVHTSAVLKAECDSEGDLAVLNSVGVPSAEWKLSSDGMFGRETNDAVDGVFSPSDGS